MDIVLSSPSRPTDVRNQFLYFPLLVQVGCTGYVVRVAQVMWGGWFGRENKANSDHLKLELRPSLPITHMTYYILHLASLCLFEEGNVDINKVFADVFGMDNHRLRGWFDLHPFLHIYP
jgi:hypothetical protein